MNRKIVVIAGLAALVAAYVGGRLFAQANAQSAPAQTRIGVINYFAALQKYEKFTFFKKEMEEAAKPLRTEIEKLSKDAASWQEHLKKNGSSMEPKKREEYEQAIVAYKRKIEDLQRDGDKKFGKRSEEQVIQLYREVQDAVQRLAAAQGFHLVLAYGEPPDGDLYSLPNVLRKIQGMDRVGSVVPFYVAPGLDITQAVVETLNRGYSGASSGVNATPTGFTK